MNAEIFDYVLFVMLLLLPGFVTQRVIAHNYPSSAETDNNKLYLLWSVTDIVILSPAYMFVVSMTNSDNIIYWTSILLISFVGGLLIGLIVSIAKRKGWFDLLEKIDIDPTAWDMIFINMKTNSKILMELTDGRIILTKWNEKSFASHNGKDVFFYNYYVLEEDNSKDINFEKKGNPCNFINRGIWINCNNIVYLEVE